MEIKSKNTVAEAIEEIKSKLYLKEPLTTDTMLVALGALVLCENKND